MQKAFTLVDQLGLLHGVAFDDFQEEAQKDGHILLELKTMMFILSCDTNVINHIQFRRLDQKRKIKMISPPNKISTPMKLSIMIESDCPNTCVSMLIAFC